MNNVNKIDIQLTGAGVISRLREAVHPRGKKALWLNHLSDQHLVEVYQRLVKGQDTELITKIAQKEWGQMVTKPAKSLCRELRIFQKRVIGDLIPQVSDPPELKEVKTDLFKKASDIASKVDGMALFAWTIAEQAKRVDMWRKQEDKITVPQFKAETTIKELGNLLEKYINLQIKLGVLDSKPSEHMLYLKTTFDGVVKHVVGENSNAIVDVANRFAKLVEKEAIVLEQDKDGRWVPEKAQEKIEYIENNENNTD